jgi:hypothetical protein
MTNHMSGTALSLFLTACMLTVTVKRSLFPAGSLRLYIPGPEAAHRQARKKDGGGENTRACAHEDFYRNPRAAQSVNKLMRFP